MEAIYDRAALVALPSAIQQKYSKHLIEITKTAPQLLLTVEHNQTQKITPPFSTTKDDINNLYGASYNISVLDSINISDSFHDAITP